MRISNSGPKTSSRKKYYSSLIAIILFIICFLTLICSWWNHSSENIELLRQTNQLQEELKNTIQERDTCNKMQANIQERLKKVEDELAFMHVRLSKELIPSTTN